MGQHCHSARSTVILSAALSLPSAVLSFRAKHCHSERSTVIPSAARNLIVLHRNLRIRFVTPLRSVQNDMPWEYVQNDMPRGHVQKDVT